MPRHNSVPTTCTASQLTDWSLTGINNPDEKVKLRNRLKYVEDLMKGGFKRDFAMFFAITTQTQIDNHGLDEFMPLLGFEKVFRGNKESETFDSSKGGGHNKQRHPETGDLTMWCTTPKRYEEALTSYHKELIELRDKIDPPKRPDPARQKYPELKGLKQAGIIQKNAISDNRIRQVLLVTPEVAYRHIKMKFGIDIKAWKNLGDTWLDLSVRQLRLEQERWKNELV